MAAKKISDRTHKIRIIWTIAKSLGIDGDTLRDLNHNINKIHSISALSDPQLERLISGLHKKKAQLKPKPEKPTVRGGSPIYLITLQQQELIRDFLVQLGWAANPKRYEGFCQRVLKKPTPRTVKEGQKIIEAFKGMIKRNYGLESTPTGEKKSQVPNPDSDPTKRPLKLVT